MSLGDLLVLGLFALFAVLWVWVGPKMGVGGWGIHRPAAPSARDDHCRSEDE